MLDFERTLALRYFQGPAGAPEGGRFLRFVLYVAVGGVAVGVGALVLALAIVRGFSREIEAKIVGFGAHVQVESLRDAPLPPGAVTADSLRRIGGVAAVAPGVLEFVLLRRSAEAIEGVSLWGVERPPAYLASQVKEGAFSFAPDATGRPGVVLGRGLARRLGVRVGDALTAFTLPTPGGSGTGVGGLAGLGGGLGGGGGGGGGGPNLRAFHVAGVYETALANFDEVYVFTDLAVARRFLGYEAGAVTRYDLTLADVDSADVLARRIEERFGPPVMARSIFDVYGNLFAWVDLQQNIVPLVIAVIVLVAAFNIVGILLMLILEKSSEVGILLSLGATAKSVRRLFLVLGFVIGVAGAVLGVAFALALAWLQLRYGLIPLPAEAYFVDRAPVQLVASDVVLVAAVAVALCTAAAYLPARVAARLDPVRVLRFR